MFPARRNPGCYTHFLPTLFAWLGLFARLVQGADWESIRVPGAWGTDGIGPASARNFHGIAWYRTWLKPPDSFFAKHERNLFAESVTLNIRGLADAHEVFINGTLIGGGGKFPPNFESGKSGNHRHKVPPGLLKQGGWNEIAIRVFNDSGPGGFLTEAPFIIDYFNECVLQGAWEFHQGDIGAVREHPVLRDRPAASAFDAFHESKRVLGASAQLYPGEKLSPEESLKKFQFHPDYLFDQMLAEPIVAQPTHLSFDEKGRLWVSQYRQYPYPAGLKMLSRDKYYRAQYDKVPPPPPNHDRGHDVISIHEDTDGDGLFDRHTVFLDGLNLANAAVRGRGGVWVMHTPYLLFYPDRNFDDIPDGPPVVHLAGFGLEDTHSVANGLVWGLDGWLYGGQGSTTTSRVVRPGLDAADASGVYYEGCMVWRYHPETRAYEIFAEGSGNTFGLEVDGEGRLYSGHNGGETRGWHYVQGGYYLKEGKDPGKFGPSRNPYVFGELSVIHPLSAVQRFSHLFAVGEGSALPPSGLGKLFSIDPLHSLVMLSDRSPRGSTFETRDLGPVLTSADEGFRPVFVVNGADGGMYVADFYEQYIAHGQHYQSQIDPTTGRIYRLRGKGIPLEKDLNLAAKSSVQLVNLLSHPNKWHRHTAIRLLGERKEESVIPVLEQELKTSAGAGALGALCALFQMGRLSESQHLEALKNSNAVVRAWAVRFAGERWGKNPGLSTTSFNVPKLPDTISHALIEMGRSEPDAEVRLQLSASARRFEVSTGLSICVSLLSRNEDLEDPFIPHFNWWVLENAITTDRNSVIALFENRSFWAKRMVLDHVLTRVMRRFAAAGTRQDFASCAKLFEMSPSAEHTASLLRGFEAAFRGRTVDGLPAELVRMLVMAGHRSLAFRVKLGVAGALDEAMRELANPKATPDDRLSLVQVFSEMRYQPALPVLLEMLSQGNTKEMTRGILQALGTFDSPVIASAVLERMGGFSPDLRTVAFNLLASRPGWAAQLCAKGEMEKGFAAGIPAEIQDRLLRLSDPQIRERAGKLFSRPGQGSQVKERMARIVALLRDAPGDRYEGEKIFAERCSSCHRLFRKGGSVGPDLTYYQRDNLETMLVSILDPNAEIREGYSAVEVETRDGRSLTGFVAEKDQNILVIRNLSSDLVTLRLSDVDRIIPTGRSLMPEGLIDDLDDQGLRNFFAYLRSSQPFSK